MLWEATFCGVEGRVLGNYIDMDLNLASTTYYLGPGPVPLSKPWFAQL